MSLFHWIVIIVAIIVFALMMAWIGIIISKASGGGAYPPVQNACPDGWIEDENAKCIIPASMNLGNLSPQDYTTIPGYMLGTTGRPMVDFNASVWQTNGKTPQCAKALWAKAHSVIWDTITNFNGC
jgi:hypothetical protein